MLEECGLPYSAHPVEIGSGAKKPPALLKFNPQGTIPTIVDHDGPDGSPLVLLQSGAILLYLSHKTGKFMPADPRHQAITFQWMMFALTDVAAANTAMYLAGTKVGDAPSAAEFFEQELLNYLRVCDNRLADSAYLAGPEMTIADVALFPVTVSRRALLDRLDTFYHLKRWSTTIGARPGVQRALGAVS